MTEKKKNEVCGRPIITEKRKNGADVQGGGPTGKGARVYVEHTRGAHAA